MMVVTGLANEQDFETGQSLYVLILNKKIRVPVSEEIAAQIIQQLYGQEKTATTEPEETEQEPQTNGYQMSHRGPYADDDSPNTDEDGIDQI